MREFQLHYQQDLWEMVNQYLGARPPVPANGPSPKEAFAIRMVWLRERLQYIPEDADEPTLRQYARCYILSFIGGYLMPDNVVLAWTYRSLYNAAERRTIDIAGYVPLIMSWIYHQFPGLSARVPDV
ncbi:hypothetical protein PIB30_068166, partial [Stylosanthes scabra]|nr:hypothetical protein [Stylosanthes scabra]